MSALHPHFVVNPAEYVVHVGDYAGEKLRDVPTAEVMRLGYGDKWEPVTDQDKDLRIAARLVAVYGE